MHHRSTQRALPALSFTCLLSVTLFAACASPPASHDDAGDAADRVSTDAPLDARAPSDATSLDASDATASSDAVSADITDASNPPTDAATGPTCWPFDPLSTATLRASTHKVFAHYFSPYPISLDNQPPATDYYARNYLNPAGESGAHEFCGGLLRERPWAQSPPWPMGTDFEERNMETEVRRAIAIGLDGFTYDVLNPNPSSIHRTRLDKLLAAIARVDPGFSVQLVLDMTTSSFGGAAGGTDATAMAGIMTLFTGVGSNPALQRLADGRIVVSAFAAERRSAAFWQNALTQLESMGYRVAFVPMPVGSWPSNSARFNGVPLYGASSWGSGTVGGATGLRTVAAGVHNAGLVWMAPVRPQDSRPKELHYTESSNSGAYRAQWAAAIEGGADWVQLITWNDYSEDSEMTPSTRTQTGFYDLAAYYIAWFKTGVQPVIARDAVYYFHRAHSMDTTVARPTVQTAANYFTAVNGPTMAENQIEIVGLLTAPGTLEIEINGHTARQDVGAGIQSFRVPLEDGTPVFRIVRGGSTVASVTSATTIGHTIAYQDPLYHAGSSSTCAQ